MGDREIALGRGGKRIIKIEGCVYVFNVRRCTKVETESIEWGWWS